MDGSTSQQGACFETRAANSHENSSHRTLVWEPVCLAPTACTVPAIISSEPIESVLASNQNVEFRNEKALSCFGSELASGNGGFQYLHRISEGRDGSPQAKRITRLGSSRKTARRFMGWSYS